MGVVVAVLVAVGVAVAVAVTVRATVGVGVGVGVSPFPSLTTMAVRLAVIATARMTSAATPKTGSARI